MKYQNKNEYIEVVLNKAVENRNGGTGDLLSAIVALADDFVMNYKEVHNHNQRNSSFDCI